MIKASTKTMASRIAALGSLGIVVLIVVLFFLANLAMNLFFSGARIDLTENSLYTISDGTRSTLQNIQEPMRVRLYVSEELQDVPALQSYASRVEGLLSQLASESNDMLKAQFITLEAFSPEEDQALAFGLSGTPLNNGQIFFGLVITNHLDQSQVVPFLTPEREPFLEYDIVKAIDSLLNRTRSKVGLLNYTNFSQADQPQEVIAISQLREQFDVVDIQTTATELPDDLAVLLLLNPVTDITDDLALAIDQYLINNGKLVVAVDPLIMHGEQVNPQGGGLPSSNPSRFFDAWGITFDASQVVVDPINSLQVNMQTPQGVQVVNQPAWLQYANANLNQTDIVSAELNQVRIIAGGALGLAQGVENITMEPLISTSDNAGIISQRVMSQPSPELWQANYKPDGKKVLAARFTGTFRSAFADSSEVTSDGFLPQTPDVSNLLVIADLDMFIDRFWVNVQNFLGQELVFRTADNGVLLQNAIDNMTSNNDLISLRSRGVRERSFVVVSELRQEANEQFKRRQEELEQRLRETEQRIAQLQQQTEGDNNALLLNQAQQTEIQRFQQQRAQTRQQLRQLQLQLNRDIENLGLLLKFLNIALLPLILLLLAVFIPSYLGRRT